MHETLVAWVPVLKDIVTAVAAAVGVWIAWRGLHAWRDQLKGRTEYDLARRLLRATFDLRQAVHRARSPFVLAGEMAQAVREHGYDLKETARDRAADREPYVLALEERLKEISEKVAAFDVEALEAEVVFGHDVRDATLGVRRACNRVAIAIQQHARDERTRSRDYPEGYDQRLMQAFGLSEQSDQDELGTEFIAAVNDVERVTRGHLR